MSYTQFNWRKVFSCCSHINYVICNSLCRVQEVRITRICLRFFVHVIISSCTSETDRTLKIEKFLSWRTAKTGQAMKRYSKLWLDRSLNEHSDLCRPIPACSAWLLTPTKDSPCIPIDAPNCTAVRGVARCRRIFSPFLMEPTSTCLPVRKKTMIRQY